MSALLLTTPKAWARRVVYRLPGVELQSPLLGRTVLVTGALLRPAAAARHPRPREQSASG